MITQEFATATGVLPRRNKTLTKWQGCANGYPLNTLNETAMHRITIDMPASNAARANSAAAAAAAVRACVHGSGA